MFTAKGGVKNVTVEAVIIKADGTKEKLGVIADTSKDSGLIGFIRHLKRGIK